MGKAWKYFTEEERKAGNRAKFNRWKDKQNPEQVAQRKLYEKTERRSDYTTMREAILVKFDKKCAKCGYNSDTRALQIDHVHGGGRAERRKSGWYTMYNRVLNDTSGEYQLLCCNCNYIKRYVNEEIHLVNDSLKSSNTCNTPPA